MELFENLVFWQYGLSLLYLIFSTWVNLKKFGMLYAPDKHDMVKKVEEHLDSSIKIKLQRHQEIILEDQSDYAATEVVGDIESLLELANSD